MPKMWGRPAACGGLSARLLVSFTLLAFSTHAEDSQARAKRVIDEAVAALGGQAFLTMQDRSESGRVYSFYREKITGLATATIYTRYVPASNPHDLGVRERDSFAKSHKDDKEMYADLFTNDGVWDISYRGVRPLPKDRLPRYKESQRRNIFYILRLHEPGMIFESQGADVLDNRPVEIVNITDADNDTTTVYFDQTTKLPTRQVFYRRDPVTKDRDEEVTVFSKYRDVGGGVQWPFDMQRMRNGEVIFQIYSESVKINQGLADSLFELPQNAKMLKEVD